MSYVLLLPSWYPDQEFPLDGNFVANHAAVIHAEIMPVKIIHVRIGKETHNEKEVTPEGMEIHRRQIRKGFSGLGWWQIKQETLRLAAELIHREGKPKYIHVHVAWPALYPAYILSKQLQVPLLLTEHHSVWLTRNFKQLGFVKKYILQKLIRKVTRCSAVSESLANAIEYHSVTKPMVIPNLVLDPYFEDLPPTTSKKYNFLHLSNFAAVKRPVEILRAFLRARSEGMKARLIMAGEPGPLKEVCRKLASESVYANDIQILDQMSAKDACELMRKCDALVGFSLYETQGITMAEAFALGKRVIQNKLPVLNIYPNHFPLHGVKDEATLAETMKLVSEMAAPLNREDMKIFIQNQMGRKQIAELFQKLYQI